ncbi:phosphatase PAP2 family protein [Rhizobiaceae bacterium BDR2-2]|uniref:Phosphatase PAP2 family protein n=1 Tax=Ectorhizobium quercum TaxID=2965071 RepID=A0AAE3N4H5_9HYPH|nr:phosphatase PAP2 family protein [Ectorhizobium quercum]MCX8999524.1 phosphatase PAP2 family protein [Ectorhizobium quercum]
MKTGGNTAFPRQAPKAPQWNLLLALLLIPVPAIAFLALDEPVARMTGQWPDLLTTLSAQTTDAVMLVPIMSALALFSGIALTLQSTRIAMKGFYAAASVLLASGIVHAIKPLVGRARPTVFEEHGLFGRKAFDGTFDYVSFPSGHAAHAGALFAALAFCFPRYRWLFAALALWFAATRLILGVHYPSDVVVGLLAGLGSAVLLARLAARYGRIFRL